MPVWNIRFLVAVPLLSVSLLGVACLDGANAQQGPPASPESASTATASVNNGQDFTRPENLLQLRYLDSTAPGTGATPGTMRTVRTEAVTLRADMMVDIAPQWTLAFRGDLPFGFKDPITADNPGGNYVSGLRDADIQAALIRQIDARIAAGAGLRIIAPTGSDDLTSGKWQAQPIVGARYSLPELSAGSYLEGIVRYNFSFAGDPTAKNISNLQFAPMVNIGLPDHWFFTLYPSTDIRLNYGDPITGQTGRLFLPFDFMVGRGLTNDVTLSLEIGVPIVRDYPVYDFKAVVRLNSRF